MNDQRDSRASFPTDRAFLGRLIDRSWVGLRTEFNFGVPDRPFPYITGSASSSSNVEMPKSADNVSEIEIPGISGDLTHDLQDLRKPTFIALKFEFDLFKWYIVRFFKIVHFEDSLLSNLSEEKDVTSRSRNRSVFPVFENSRLK